MLVYPNFVLVSAMLVAFRIGPKKQYGDQINYLSTKININDHSLGIRGGLMNKNINTLFFLSKH